MKSAGNVKDFPQSQPILYKKVDETPIEDHARKPG
jgi:hypothetical protein